MTQVIVIGGGPAGVTAAMRARELGAQVILVERGRMGGTCTNDGCVPTRVLAHSARLLRDARQFSAYGLDGTPPKLDFQRLMSQVGQIVYSIHEKKQLLGHLDDIGVHVISEAGPARFTSAYSLALPDGRKLEADRFILCAGGRARRIDFPGAELALMHSDLWALRKLPASVAILGAAATGSQLASILRDFGSQVTLLDLAPRILRTEDEVISHMVGKAFEARGIELITGIDGVERLEKHDNWLRLVYRNQDEVHTRDVEAVLLSTGWVGNLESLNLPAAGIETVGPYVRVNDHLQTSATHIYAAGDITGRMMLVQSAGNEALAAAENAVLGPVSVQRHQIVPHGGFTDPEYASVGLTEAQARQSSECIVAQVSYAELDRAVIDGHTLGMCKLIVAAEDHRILGAHVVGEQALEIVHMAAAGMAADMWVENLADLQIAYPTYTAIIGLAARKIVRELGVVPIAAEWCSLGQRARPEWELRSTLNGEFGAAND